MDGVPRLLDSELLDRFDAVLAAQAGDLLGAVGPAVPEGRVRAQFAELGVEPTDELVAWFTRHEWNEAMVLPAASALPLGVCAEAYGKLRNIAADTAERGRAEHRPPPIDAFLDVEYWWSRHWFPVFSSGGRMKIPTDCHGAPDAPTPVLAVDPEDAGTSDYGRVVEPSLGAAIEAACTALERGRCRYDPVRGLWAPTENGSFISMFHVG